MNDDVLSRAFPGEPLWPNLIESPDANPMPDVSVGSRQLVDVFHDWVSDFLVWLLGWLVR